MTCLAEQLADASPGSAGVVDPRPWHGPSRYERAHPATGEVIDYERVCATCAHHLKIRTKPEPEWRCSLAPTVTAPRDEVRRAWPACTLWVAAEARP